MRPTSTSVVARPALAAAAASILLLAARPAWGVELKITGGMGVTLWPLGVAGVAGERVGFGAGINGRLLMQIGPHVRLQAGLLQGEFNLEDRTHVVRRIIGAAAEAVRAPTENTYFTVGIRLGAENLEMEETVGILEPGRRAVSDVDRWAFVAQPIVTGGVRIAGRYHIELETGIVLSQVDGRFSVSYTAVLGIYFRMGGRHGLR